MPLEILEKKMALPQLTLISVCGLEVLLQDIP